MKKAYINPDTKIVKVELQQMIAGSPIEMRDDVEGVTPGNTLSRRGGFWDDEEE